VDSLQSNVLDENTLALRPALTISVIMFLEICFIVVLAIGVAALFWFMVRQSSEKIVRQYRKIAQQLQLDLTEPTPQLAGFIRAEPFVHGMYRLGAVCAWRVSPTGDFDFGAGEGATKYATN